jgi:hypothetical protein
MHAPACSEAGMGDERLVRFFSGGGDDAGRTHAAILAWDDVRLEQVHDYIQWLFPLPERSGANPSAPLLDPESIAAISADPSMQARLRAGFVRMVAFYGFEQRQGELIEGAGFAQAAENWMSPGNHNHLRITRMLRSLRVLGLDAEAAMFWRALDALYRKDSEAGRRRITERSFAYWKQAALEHFS